MVEWRLDEDSSVPYYLQVENQIKHGIEEGIWQAGERIPSERELMQILGLSRATIRQALNSLVYKRVLKKDHGRGTFVESPYDISDKTIYSFSEQLRQTGIVLEDTSIERQIIPADSAIAYRLNISEGTELIGIKRVRRVNGTPLMVNIFFIPLAGYAGLMQDSFNTSLYHLLTGKYGVKIDRAIDRIEAVTACRELSELLEIPELTPLMFIDRTVLTTAGTALKISYNYVRSDICYIRSDPQSQVAIELKIPPSD